ncbi:hypothetical protein [Shimia haliotis]|uniref:hypothetical protein n=1 Tax=Shimia haliotis TaxID=1280847 RepID=UPI0011138DAA|nr:hypothetical protein [Shimia haliotis]
MAMLHGLNLIGAVVGVTIGVIVKADLAKLTRHMSAKSLFSTLPLAMISAQRRHLAGSEKVESSE